MNPGNSTQKSINFDWSSGAGYFHTFIINSSFYFSLGIVPGIGFIHTKLLTRFPNNNIEAYQNNFLLRFNAMGAIGYNGRDFFAGLYVNYVANKYNQEKTTVVNYDNRIYYQFLIGLRLNAPSYLKKFMNNFDL